MESTRLSDVVMGRLVVCYAEERDPARAAPMRAYMRDQFEFLGIPMARRRKLSREVLAGLPRPAEVDLRAVALACWRLPEREYQYFACDWLRDNAEVCTPAFLLTARTLITERSWWDTVDLLATHVVGRIVAAYPRAAPTMDAWSTDDNLWLVRTALLHQLNFHAATDPVKLFGYCLGQAAHRDFFVRKAIGWALRAYARSNPTAVQEFVTENRSRLSGLSVREALKHHT
jgi:3-methyladenine DNA glycosylase AlkD